MTVPPDVSPGIPPGRDQAATPAHVGHGEPDGRRAGPGGGVGPVLAVVLAAGAGSRFAASTAAAGTHDHKLLQQLPSPDGSTRSVIERAVGAAVAAAIGPVVVITGAAEVDGPLRRRFGAEVELVANPRWASGQATSLAVAMELAARRGAAAVVVGLGDQPAISPEAWRAVAAADSPIAVATYAGRRGNPVRLAAQVWPLVATTGDEGARALIRVRPDLVEAVPCPGSPADIDTVEDLRRWQSS